LQEIQFQFLSLLLLSSVSFITVPLKISLRLRTKLNFINAINFKQEFDKIESITMIGCRKQLPLD